MPGLCLISYWYACIDDTLKLVFMFPFEYTESTLNTCIQFCIFSISYGYLIMDASIQSRVHVLFLLEYIHDQF